MQASTTVLKPKATLTVNLLENLEMSHPANWSPTKELAGMISRSDPSSMSLNPKLLFNVGIRAVRLAYSRPEIKKNKLINTR